MKTTKNISVNGNQKGFVIRNNYNTVDFAKDLQSALKIAENIAKVEKKDIIVNDIFFTMKVRYADL